ncbi:MAG: hypothetical protein GY729_11295 [Desulfobacteraceae bacterium]|nr:hypothetical protein [Desulfobacteraceae bacterium]
MVDYLGSFKQSVITSRVGKAKDLLKDLKSKDQDEKMGALHVLALAPDKIAIELLDFLAQKQNQDPDIFPRVVQLVTDRAHLNFKFAQILYDHAGRDTLLQAAPLLKHVLINETDTDILTATLRTIGEEKLEPLTDDVAEFIFYDDDYLKAEAIYALEKIGTPMALNRLEQCAQTQKCDANILETINDLRAKLEAKAEEDETEAQAPAPAKASVPVPEKHEQPDHGRLVEQLGSSQIDKRYEAFIKLSELGTQVSKDLAKNLKTGDHDMMINILRLLSRTIPRDAVSNIFSVMTGNKPEPNIKFAAYLTLASFPELESAAAIVKGLSESAMHVRMAAVKVLDKNLTDYVCAEIKNKIESGTKTGEQLGETILDAQANNIIEYLTISDSFSYITSNYLSKNAPVPTLDNYIHVLEKRKLKSTVKKYKSIKKERENNKKGAFVVISSADTILKIYEKLLSFAGCSTETFSSSQDAFETIVSKQPKGVICDLFLNDMTAFDFAREVRQIYPKEDVVFIISALQRNWDKDMIKKELDASGVNFMYNFPPKPNQVKSWVN